MKNAALVVLGTVAILGACRKGPAVVLRNPEVYRNEVAFLQMALEQDTAIIEEHLADGSCKCDEDGAWSSESCETAALNVLVIRHRLAWHVDMMLYLGRLSETRPPEEPPEIPDPSTLCPGE